MRFGHYMSQRGDDLFRLAFLLQYTQQSICIARRDMYPLAVGTHFGPRFLDMVDQRSLEEVGNCIELRM